MWLIQVSKINNINTCLNILKLFVFPFLKIFSDLDKLKTYKNIINYTILFFIIYKKKILILFYYI